MAARVLLAEDDQGIRALVGSVLYRAGLNVEFAADGKEAIEHLQANSYDAILLDLMMPTASGFEVLAWMHKEKRGAAMAERHHPHRHAAEGAGPPHEGESVRCRSKAVRYR